MTQSSKTPFRLRPEIVLFVAAFALQLITLNRFAASPYFLPDSDDMQFYSAWGSRIAQGQLTDGQAFYGLPGYAYILGLIYSLVGFDPYAVGLLQITMHSAIAVVIFKLARLSFSHLQFQRTSENIVDPGTVIGCLAGLGWCFFQPASCFSIILMPTTWLVLAYWGGVWWIAKINHSTPLRPWLALGILTGLVATLVATVLFLIPLLAIGAARTVHSDKAFRLRIASVAVALCAIFGGIMIGTAPAWLHNRFVAKEPVFLSAHSGINFWIGNSPVATGYPMMPANLRASQEGLLQDSITVAQRESGRPLKRYEVSKFWTAKAHHQISSDYGRWVNLLGVKVKNFWNAFQYDDLAIIKLLSDDGVLLPGLRFGIVAAFGLPGLLLAGWRFPRAWWVSSAVLLHMCALLPVFVTERYRLAAVPGLLILGAFGLYQLCSDLSFGKWRNSAAYLALLALSAWFVSAPQKDIGLWSFGFLQSRYPRDRRGRIRTRAEESADRPRLRARLSRHQLRSGERVARATQPPRSQALLSSRARAQAKPRTSPQQRGPDRS
jgi:hypothetical protein